MKVKAENHPVAGVAFITGGGGGIGGATAERLAANGVSVVVADFNAKLAEAVAERIISRGGRALPMAVDVTKLAEVNAAVSAAEAALGPIDFLVNTAGHFQWASTEDISGNDFEDMFRVHVFGMHSMVRSVLFGMQSDEQELS